MKRHWTPSKLQDFESCPSFFEGRHILRLPEPPSTAMARGNAIHTALEIHVAANAPLPGFLDPWAKQLAEIKAGKPTVEEMWSFGPGWDLRASPLWCRLKLDVFLPLGKKRAKVIDYKTGRIYEKHAGQMEIYAVAAFTKFPSVEELQIELWYIDQEEITEREYNRKQYEDLKAAWAERGDRLVHADTFKPTPSPDACRWCPRHKKKGGDCPVGV